MTFKSKMVLIPSALLISLLSFVAGTKYETQIKNVLINSNKQSAVLQLPKQAKVQRIIDGDTVELQNGTILRYAGITAPEISEPFAEESTKKNKRLVEGKTITLEYDSYTSDKFNRILAYAIIDGKNVSLELVKTGLAKVVIYQKRKTLIYQDQLLKAQSEAQKKKLGIWGQ
ncbi:thermonuclease family protein [Candidatus Amesbacteria bacterium]|nr:thermonuclease family protein [Candidatus Amesbacteria bacterium]